MVTRRSDQEDTTPTPPSWYTYVLIASLAGGGGGFIGAFTDPMRTDPTARPDPYTGSMAKADFAARDYRMERLEKQQEKLLDSCERTQKRLDAAEHRAWRLQEECRLYHGTEQQNSGKKSIGP